MLKTILSLIFGILTSIVIAQDQDIHSKRREKMVNNQIVRRGIDDPLIVEAMLKVERHRFVSKSQEKLAYNDHPLPIGMGQTISQPYIVAFMTDILGLSRDDKVLEIGTGSGYQAAILGELCDEVYTIEIVEELGNRSKALLAELGYDNIKVRVGDGYQGWVEYAPFDAIIVTCAPTDVPQPLQDQLAEGGRMIIPVGSFGNQRLVLLRKNDGKLKKVNVLNVRFVPMVDDTGRKY